MKTSPISLISRIVALALSLLVASAAFASTHYYPGNTCATETWTTGKVNVCGSAVALCPGYCYQRWYPHAKCWFNPLDQCAVSVGVQVIAEEYWYHCSISAGGSCLCDSGAYAGPYYVYVTSDICV